MLNLPRHILPGLLAACVLVSGFFWLREGVTTRIYRQKLEYLAGEYTALADQYNYAVRQSAITELQVTEDSLAVLIRTVDGRIRQIPTPFDPNREIFVDYLVADGRIWIRRVFDQATPPESGMVIDPLWDVVDWKNSDLRYGKVIYRALDPGIWAIQVSGNGSLSLEPASDSYPDALMAAPEIRSFEEIRLAIEQEANSIGWVDIWNYCTSLLSN